MNPRPSAVPQPTALSPTPLFYQKYANYTKHVGNTREDQHLYTELRFQSKNHTKMKVNLEVKFLYLREKTSKIMSHSFNKANIVPEKF